MIAKNSSLRIVTLDILKIDYSFSFPSTSFQVEEVQKILSGYSLDIDYFIRSEGEEYQVYVKALINHKTSLPGYKIDMQSVGVFLIDEKMTKEEENAFIMQSALPMVISFIRTFLITLTTNFPFGKYIMPSIDMADLRAKKLIEIRERSKTTASATKSAKKVKTKAASKK